MNSSTYFNSMFECISGSKTQQIIVMKNNGFIKFPSHSEFDKFYMNLNVTEKYEISGYYVIQPVLIPENKRNKHKSGNVFEKSKLTTEWDFQKNDLHPLEVQLTSVKKFWWKCSFGHSWSASPSERNKGSGCKICQSSKLERICVQYLDSINEHYECQWSFDSLRRLKYDFHLPEKKVIIEIDGKQHFTEVPHFQGKDLYQDKRYRDILKHRVALMKDYKIIRIDHTISSKHIEYHLKKGLEYEEKEYFSNPEMYLWLKDENEKILEILNKVKNEPQFKYDKRESYERQKMVKQNKIKKKEDEEYIPSEYELISNITEDQFKILIMKNKESKLEQQEKDMIEKYNICQLVLDPNNDQMNKLWKVYNLPKNKLKFHNLNLERKFLEGKNIDYISDEQKIKLNHINIIYEICGISDRKNKVISRKKFNLILEKIGPIENKLRDVFKIDNYRKPFGPLNIPRCIRLLNSIFNYWGFITFSTEPRKHTKINGTKFVISGFQVDFHIIYDYL